MEKVGGDVLGFVRREALVVGRVADAARYPAWSRIFALYILYAKITTAIARIMREIVATTTKDAKKELSLTKGRKVRSGSRSMSGSS